MRIKIFRFLPEPDKRNIRLVCQLLKADIDSLVGLKIQLYRPIESNQLFEWIQILRINEIDVRAKNMTTWELMFLLQNRACLQSVNIQDPKDFDLIPVLTMLSALDTLRELCITHVCKSYLSFLPISINRFSRLQRMLISITIGPEDISLDTAQFFLHVSCPQLQVLSLTVSLDPKNSSMIVGQSECLNCSHWLLAMIETLPSVRFLWVELYFYRFALLHYTEHLGE